MHASLRRSVVRRASSLGLAALCIAAVLGWHAPSLAQSRDTSDEDEETSPRPREGSEPSVREPGTAASKDGPDGRIAPLAGTPESEGTTPRGSGLSFDSGSTLLEAAPGGAYRLAVRAPAEVRPLLVRHLDLARFRTQDDIAPIEVARLMAATPAQARALLEPEGYFEARVQVRRIEAAEGGVPTVLVEVEPGAPMRIAKVDFSLTGPWAEAMKLIDDDGLRLKRRWGRLQSRWSLPVGERFTQRGWSDAKNALLVAARSRGHANARYTDTAANIDVPARRAELAVAVESGPLYRIGELRIEGLERTPESAARNLLPFSLGEVYSESRLLDYQDALQKVGLYEGIAVELDLDSPDPERAVLVARLREAVTQNATVSVGFSSNTGPRVGLEHTHRRFLGRDLVASTRLKLGRDEREAAFDLLTYPRAGGVRDLVGAKLDYLDAGGAISDTMSVRIGRQRSTQRIDRLVYLEALRTTLETATQRRSDEALFANVQWAHRDVNSLVFPTRGLIVGAEAGGGYATSEDGAKGPFGRLRLAATWYQPLPGGWIGRWRGEAAQVIKKDDLGVPDTLLFRAGGDDSVRGYAYRTLGPVRDGAVVGGPVLATGSIELMRRFSERARWRDWYGAVFVDAGNAALGWDELDPALGYGVGVRWRSPIGPLRVDVAYGDKVSALRLHISVGVSF